MNLGDLRKVLQHTDKFLSRKNKLRSVSNIHADEFYLYFTLNPNDEANELNDGQFRIKYDGTIDQLEVEVMSTWVEYRNPWEEGK